MLHSAKLATRWLTRGKSGLAVLYYQSEGVGLPRTAYLIPGRGGHVGWSVLGCSSSSFPLFSSSFKLASNCHEFQPELAPNSPPS